MNERTLAALNKVPEVTIAFWVIKILSTTVGETVFGGAGKPRKRVTRRSGRLEAKV